MLLWAGVREPGILGHNSSRASGTWVSGMRWQRGAGRGQSGPGSPRREFAFIFTQSEAGGGFLALSPEVTCSNLRVSELCVEWRGLRVGCGEAERTASKTVDKNHGRRLGPSCCLDDGIGSGLIKRGFCHPCLERLTAKGEEGGRG